MHDNLIGNRRGVFLTRILNIAKAAGAKAIKVVFLDPDTGLAPQKANAEHVTCKEITSIWHQLKRGDHLVLCQHSFRDTNWREIRRGELAQACNISPSMIQTWEASDKTKDVVFLYCEKINSVGG